MDGKTVDIEQHYTVGTSLKYYDGGGHWGTHHGTITAIDAQNVTVNWSSCSGGAKPMGLNHYSVADFERMLAGVGGFQFEILKP
jgi:hypothetical protein